MSSPEGEEETEELKTRFPSIESLSLSPLTVIAILYQVFNNIGAGLITLVDSTDPRYVATDNFNVLSLNPKIILSL